MEIRESVVNPKSSKYMYIDKSESENMYRKHYREHRHILTCEEASSM